MGEVETHTNSVNNSTFQEQIHKKTTVMPNNVVIAAASN